MHGRLGIQKGNRYIEVLKVGKKVTVLIKKYKLVSRISTVSGYLNI